MNGIIEINNLHAGYVRDNWILNIPNLKFADTEEKIFGIFGSNHVGKSTFLKIIGQIRRGIILSDKASISYGEENPNISYIPQRYAQTILPWFSIDKNLALPLLAKGENKEAIENKINNVCEELGYGDKENFYRTFGFYELLEQNKLKMPMELSGGQQQMLVLFRGLITSPSILIMDEPFSALDTYKGAIFRRNLLDYIESKSVTTIFVSHSLKDTVAMAHKIIFLKPIANNDELSIVGEKKVGKKVRKGPNLDEFEAQEFIKLLEKDYLSGE